MFNPLSVSRTTDTYIERFSHMAQLENELVVFSTPDMIEKLTINRPVGGYLTQPTFTNGNAIISIENIRITYYFKTYPINYKYLNNFDCF